MTKTIAMEATQRLEIGFGHVHEDGKAWMFSEYFPTYGPVMASFGLQNLVSFRVLGSNAHAFAPVQGSLNSWPSAKHRRDLLEEPSFAAILPKRDAMLTLSDGHLFEPLAEPVSVDTDQEYALIIGDVSVHAEEAIFRTPLTEDSASQVYEGKFLSLHQWSEACERLLSAPAADTTVLRVQFNP